MLTKKTTINFPVIALCRKNNPKIKRRTTVYGPLSKAVLSKHFVAGCRYHTLPRNCCEEISVVL